MHIWAAHPKPKEGELLSSWLTRLASECGMSAKQFCSEVLAVRNPNLRIIDRSPDDQLLEGLIKGTGVPIERILETSLIAEEGYLFSQSGQGSTRWIIPALTNHAAKSKFATGIAYCPECLRTDATPYYRKNWRYSFNSICPTHRIPLRNACPNCERPYSHIHPVPQRNIDANSPITTCWACRCDVTKAVANSPWGGHLLDQTLPIQANILAGISCGAFDIPSHGHVNSHTYLDTLYCIIRSLADWREHRTRMKIAWKLSGIDYQEHEADPANFFGEGYFEQRCAENRAIILCLADWMMDEWPARLVSYAKKADLSYSKLFAGIDESYWFSACPIPLSGRQFAPTTPSAEEKANAAAVLRKRLGRAVSNYEVEGFMANGTLGNQIKTQAAARKSARKWHQKFVEEWAADLQKTKNRRLAKIITWSKSKKFLQKIQAPQQTAEPPSTE